MAAVLELHLTCARGREQDCAQNLESQIQKGDHWAILVELAAEILRLHESRQGSTVVLVTGSAQAERVLQDLRKA